MGRPTDYSEDILTKAREYLSARRDEVEEYHKTRGEKSDTYDRLVRVKLPTIEGLAVYLQVHRDTLYEWEKQHPAFSDILAELRSEQADRLINSGLSGDYNPTIAKVLLTKHGYREGHEHTGPDGDALFDDDTKKKAKAAVGQSLARTAGEGEQGGD